MKKAVPLQRDFEKSRCENGLRLSNLSELDCILETLREQATKVERGLHRPCT